MSKEAEGPDGEEVRAVVNAVREAVDALEAMRDDPEKQAVGAGLLLSSWPEQQTRLRQLRQRAVLELRARKVSYRQIAAKLQISVARVQQIEAGETGRSGRARGGAAEE